MAVIGQCPSPTSPLCKMNSLLPSFFFMLLVSVYLTRYSNKIFTTVSFLSQDVISLFLSPSVYLSTVCVHAWMCVCSKKSVML